MLGFNCSFIIEKVEYVEWMAATVISNKLNTYEKRHDFECLFQRNIETFENTGSLQVAYRKNDSCSCTSGATLK